MLAAPAAPAPSKAPTPLSVELTGHRFVETFGFSCGAIGLAGLLVALGIVLDSSTVYASWHLPTAIAVGLLGSGYETFRRRQRFAFVPHEPDRVGIYRRGKLRFIAHVSDFVRYRLSPLQTFRQFVAFGLPALVGSIFLVVFVSELGSEHGSFHVTALLLSTAASVGGIAGLVATVWSRVVCVQYILDSDHQEREEIVLRRSDAEKLLSGR